STAPGDARPPGIGIVFPETAAIAVIQSYDYSYGHKLEAHMTTYSVADAKAGLPRLIDRALEGEEVVISRHGRPVAELRRLQPAARAGAMATYEWLRQRRAQRAPVAVTSVELLNELYESEGD
ncbi:MAG TPA: type II toxin-antitoxin system prevent-host-death family antitoxin, partial [Phenylobacterium sp.]|uniref:type II toxin-antitoxin system Phd/YefM family antitoxin n=1 Tax=Phenylobacterium sp. TaxID=1871053 RepID=UPI002B497F95